MKQILIAVAVVAAQFIVSNALAANAYIACKNGSSSCSHGTSYTNNNPISVTEWCVCKTVTNTLSQDVFIPTKTSTEWSDFYNRPPAGVTISACSPDPTNVTDSTYTGTVIDVPVPNGCTKLSITATGASGGGGKTKSGVAGSGGNGGQVATGQFTIPGGVTKYQYEIGQKGQAGNCSVLNTTAAAGGLGIYDGGNGSLSTGNPGGTPGQPGASSAILTCPGGSGGTAGASSFAGGNGGCGGGGGGGDNVDISLRNGGAGGAATTVYSYSGSATEIIDAGGGGGGGGGNGAGKNAGNACNGTSSGANGVNGSSSQGAGGGGGGCACSAINAACIGPTYSAVNVGGTQNGACGLTGDGTDGSVSFVFAP